MDRRLQGGWFLKLDDFTSDEIDFPLRLSAELKDEARRDRGPASHRQRDCALV
jgi:hypothetical protein